MDASAPSNVDADINDVYAFFLKIENADFPTPLKQRSTIIKYTKLPEFDFESKGSWSRHSYSLQPRLRRIIALEEPGIVSGRSLKTAVPMFHSNMTTSINNRKIVTISEDEEYDLQPKLSKELSKHKSGTSNRSAGTELEKDKKQIPQRITSNITSTPKNLNETKPGSKISSVLAKKVVRPKFSNSSKPAIDNQMYVGRTGSKIFKEKEAVKKTKSALLSKTNVTVSKNLVTPSESKQSSIAKGKLNDVKRTSSKKNIETPRKNLLQSSSNRSKASFLIELNNKQKHLPVIHVPLDRKYHEQGVETETLHSVDPTIVVYTNPDGTLDTDVVLHKNNNTETEPLPRRVDQVTDMEDFQPEIIYKCVESTDVQTDLIEGMFDKLEIPNVSLKKDKEERIESLGHSMSLPNLQIPRESLKISDNRSEKAILDAQYCKSTSYVISRSTLTYRTQQEINFHVVGSDANQPSSPLTYPMNVVSVFKEEMSKGVSNNISVEKSHSRKSSKEYKNCINEIKSLDCSYVPNSNKLMKPSDIISTIRVNNSLLQTVYMCEQFQRELNFIDSFFESLQYLESCSLTEKCFVNDDNINRLVNNQTILDSQLAVKTAEYDNFLSEFENATETDSCETMASKNLLLLNILIRDEQRRAKNFLCVLKRREDALKDFTKSQILYLENKKKQDKTDISALKKKQRGALLKLQHECGEMQRMRKALLQLSEKREIALMKTKKDLELKLKNNVDVKQIINGKKKVKRNSLDRTSVPVKCFDLTSSGCEDSTLSRNTLEDVSTPELAAVAKPTTSVEKSSQTGDSFLEPTLVNQSTDTAAEHFVVVDGSYLNILFNNLTLPQIFSGGKQYEVNEDALRNIVDSTNSQPSENWGDVLAKLMDQVHHDVDKSSTPSTARSLVEELEQYYKTLGDEDRSSDDRLDSPRTSDVIAQTSTSRKSPDESQSRQSVSTMTADCSGAVEDGPCRCESPTSEDKELPTGPTGPLPVPAGAARVDTASSPSWPAADSFDATFTDSSASSADLCDRVSSVSSMAEPSLAEAEELRRQQLAIEREIKELEQQQCQLLVVREIPDKPPPPYTPPADARAQTSRAFQPDDVSQHRMRTYTTDAHAQPCDPENAFELLVHDFCKDTVARHKVQQSDKPWDSCNLLPQKAPLEPEKLVEIASTELREVLTPATPSIVSGVSSRRSDHIDDILFEQWRRVEPEWTSLHTDEAIVKNQLFETIFQRILTETVDEYKRSILSPEVE